MCLAAAGCSKFKVQGSKFKVQGSRFKVQSSKFKVRSSKFKVQSSKFKVRSSKFEVQSSKFKVRSSKQPKGPGRRRLGIGHWSFIGQCSLLISHCSLHPLQPPTMSNEQSVDRAKQLP